jgi:hypothetical protein
MYAFEMIGYKHPETIYGEIFFVYFQKELYGYYSKHALYMTIKLGSRLEYHW